MGRWSQGEHERQLITKIKKLFEKSLSDPLLERPEDQRFTTFIRQLDPDDKIIQASFQSLVQNMLYMNSRNSRRYRDDMNSREARLARSSFSPPPLRRTASRSIPMARRSQPGPGPGLRHIASVRVLNDRNNNNNNNSNQEVSVTSPVTSRPTSPDPIGLLSMAPDSPSARRRSPSPSFSPSRARHFEIASADPAISPPHDVPRDASPALSESHAWVEEYRQNVGTGDAGRGRSSVSTSFIDTIMNASYGSIPRQQRRRRLVEDDGEGRRVRQRIDTDAENEERRDTRRDGVVFESVLPFMNSNSSALDGSRHLEDIWDLDLPHRRHGRPRGVGPGVGTGQEDEEDHMWNDVDGYIDFLPHLQEDLESEPEFI